MSLSLIDNEKKILTLLSKSRQLTKRELQKDGGMSWSTVTKIVNRLLEKELIEESGIKAQNIQGKDAVTYCLKFERPLFLSMDISYDYLRVLLTNLRGDRITYYEEITPEFKEFKELTGFLKEFIGEFIEKINGRRKELKGIGISLPLFLVNDSHENFYLDIKSELEEFFDMRVEVAGASNSYCYYLKFNEDLPADIRNQAVILNRRGLGASFILNGEVITGSNNMTGEIGHWKLGKNNERCRCGQRGCIENDLDFTGFTERVKRYLEDLEGGIPRESEVLKRFRGLLDSKDDGAEEIMGEVISSYEKILSFISVSLDINHFTIVGLWDGLEDYLVDGILESFMGNNFLNKGVKVSYLRFDEHNFISKGPVFKLLNEYIQA